MAGAGAGAEIVDKSGTGVGGENKYFRLRNTAIKLVPVPFLC